MTDKHTPKDEQAADRDRKLLDDARRQVEEARRRVDETATSPQDTRLGTSRAGFVVPDRVGSVRLVREIGRGGMGVVHLGRDELLERNVAVKFLLNAVSGPDDPDFTQFLKGARAAAAVRHPGLTVIHHADLVENVPYLVLEYIDGPTLRQVVKQTGPLSVAATLAVMDAVSTAIGELHERGIIHRDIKPSNVLLDHDGRVFVTDFGLACARPPGTAGPTITGVAGTLAYMAPEMFEGVVSAHSDVYALGIMAYELLTGELPFTGDADELRSKHKQNPLPLDALRKREVDPAVIEVIERATHKDMMFRQKSARHLLEALNRAVPDRACWAEGRKALPQLVSRVQADPAAVETTESGSSSSQDYYETIGAQAARKRDARPPADERAMAKGKPDDGPAAQNSLEDPLWCAVRVMVRSGDVIEIMERLEELGASAILQTRITNCRL
ncbi:MAG: protein kinase [Planctomycetes bacterium]|nr:protein kinase [Planctomycetota bacterium]